MDLRYARCGGSRSGVVKTVCIYRKDQSLVLYGEIMALHCGNHVKRIDGTGKIQNISIKYGSSTLPTRH